jgi:hypothetical protein
LQRRPLVHCKELRTSQKKASPHGEALTEDPNGEATSTKADRTLEIKNPLPDTARELPIAIH